MFKKVLDMFVFFSQKIVTSNKNVLYCVSKFKWSEQTGSYWRQLSDKIMSLYTHLLGRCLWNTHSMPDTTFLHVLCPWNTHCMPDTHFQQDGVHETHLLCLTHFYSKSYGVHETAVFKMTENHHVRANSGVFARTDTRKRQAMYV